MDAQPRKNYFNKATKQWHYIGDRSGLKFVNVWVTTNGSDPFRSTPGVVGYLFHKHRV